MTFWISNFDTYWKRNHKISVFLIFRFFKLLPIYISIERLFLDLSETFQLVRWWCCHALSRWWRQSSTFFYSTVPQVPGLCPGIPGYCAVGFINTQCKLANSHTLLDFVLDVSILFTISFTNCNNIFIWRTWLILIRKKGMMFLFVVRFDCYTGPDIDSICTADGTWAPYPTCEVIYI